MVDKDYQVLNENGLEVLKSRMWDHIITDPDYVDQPPVSVYQEFCTGNIILCCDPTKRPVGPNPHECLAWIKPISTKWTSKRCNKFFEEILVYKGKTSIFNVVHWSSMSGIFTDGFITKPDHPYAKPPTLMEKLVLMYTKPGDLVFDPFCGSGTLGVAALKHGRRYVGCEINKDFFEMAKNRIETGSFSDLI
jgi:hypothetical protein